MAGIQRAKHSFSRTGPSGGRLRWAPRPLCLLLCIKGRRGLRNHTIDEGGPRSNSVFELCFARRKVNHSSARGHGADNRWLSPDDPLIFRITSHVRGRDKIMVWMMRDKV